MTYKMYFSAYSSKIHTDGKKIGFIIFISQNFDKSELVSFTLETTA